jgi:hypothetical protein
MSLGRLVNMGGTRIEFVPDPATLVVPLVDQLPQTIIDRVARRVRGFLGLRTHADPPSVTAQRLLERVPQPRGPVGSYRSYYAAFLGTRWRGEHIAQNWDADEDRDLGAVGEVGEGYTVYGAIVNYHPGAAPYFLGTYVGAWTQRPRYPNPHLDGGRVPRAITNLTELGLPAGSRGGTWFRPYVWRSGGPPHLEELVPVLEEAGVEAEEAVSRAFADFSEAYKTLE